MKQLTIKQDEPLWSKLFNLVWQTDEELFNELGEKIIEVQDE